MRDPFDLGFAFGSVFVIGVLPFALLALAIPYAVLRLRSDAREPPDPQLGAKAGLQYFFSLAVILALVGLTIMAVDLITSEAPQAEGFNSAQRTGLAMTLSGLLFVILHLLLALALTNKIHWPRVRRTFVGWRFAIHGVVVIFTVTALAITLLQKDAFAGANFRTMKALFAILLVWVPSWLLHLMLLRLYAMQPKATAPQATWDADG